MTTSPQAPSILHLRGGGVSVLIDARGPGQPSVLHWGDDLGSLGEAELADMARALIPPVPRSVIDEPMQRGLVPERALGYRGRPGLSGFRSVGDLRPQLRLTAVEAAPTGVVVTMLDDLAGLSIRSIWELDDSGLLRIRNEVTNTGRDRLPACGTGRHPAGSLNRRRDHGFQWSLVS